jgi:ABC-2 type transport system permease protein
MACFAYRGHFYFSLAGTAIYLVVAWFLWKAVYASGGTIGGLTFVQAYLYVGISMSLYGLMQTGTDFQLNNMVRSGDLLRFLTKPIDFKSQLFADIMGNGIVNGIMIAIPSLVLVYALSGSGAPPLERMLLFIPSIAIGFLLNFFFDFLAGLSVFLTHSIAGISNTKQTTVMFLSGAIVPLPFFPSGMRRVLEWLPFQALYNTPARLLTDGSLGTAETLMFFLKQAAWLLVFYLLVRLLFSAALKRVVVNGG